MKDFFNNPRLQEQLADAVAKAREHTKTLHQPAAVSAGDSFLFTESIEMPVRWIAILTHKHDPNLWYFVVADEFPMVGMSDIELPESDPMSPLILRCGIGLWVHTDDIEMDRYVGCLNEEWVVEARIRLSEMVRGTVPFTAHGRIAEDDDELAEWLQELYGVAAKIECRIQARPSVLQSPTFDKTWVDHVIVADNRDSIIYSFAADAMGSQSITEPPAGFVLSTKQQGTIVIQQKANELDLVFIPAHKDDSPPRLWSASGIIVKDGHWEQGVDGVWTWSQVLVVVEGRLSLAIGNERFELQW